MSYLEEAIQHRSSAVQLRDLAEELDLTRSYDASRIARTRASEEERLAEEAEYRSRVSDELRELQMAEIETPMTSASRAA